MIGVLLATFTACTWGSISVLEARVSRALGGPSAVAWIFGFGLLVIMPIALIHGIPDASTSSWVWAGVASFSPAMRFSRSTSAWFFSSASGVKRGRTLRKSPSAILVSLFIAPVRKPLPSGL